jgi:hypothetical protein
MAALPLSGKSLDAFFPRVPVHVADHLLKRQLRTGSPAE